MAPRPVSAPISLVLHGDVLDPWSWIVERRIAIAAEELHGRFRPLAHAPLPRRWDARAPSPAERRNRARELKRAAREPDAPSLSPELWTGQGPLSSSSAPALIALAAARLQGRSAESSLREALRQGALSAGLDVTRSDVIVELAARAGLDLAAFVPAFEATATERSVREEIHAGYDLGIDDGPALVINEDWLVAGVRPLKEYRIVLKRYLAARAGTVVAHTVH